MAKHLILGSAGHVDHGKTTLIKALTGFDCDTHKEEKERGITINLGFTHLDLSSGNSLGIVDVPGHKDFIKTMVAGAYGIDIVLLVIAADSGIMPQTKEHFNIIKMLDIKHGVIVINKADLADDDMLDLVKIEVMELVDGSNLENAPIVAVSSITGNGIDELKEVLDSVVTITPERKDGDVFRMYIDRIFNVKGYGCVVTGSVLNGSVASESDLYLLPGRDKRVKVKSLERHGQKVDNVHAGDRAAINLAGLKIDEYRRGMLLSNLPLLETPRFDAVLTLFDNDTKLKTWSNVNFYTGTFSASARIHLINKDILSVDEQGIVQIHLETPGILMNYDRFIIRNSSNDKTLGGGWIFDANPLHHKRRSNKLIHDLTIHAETASASDRTIQLLAIELKKSAKPLLKSDLLKRFNLGEAEFAHAINSSDEVFRTMITTEATILCDNTVFNKLKDTTLNLIATFHKLNPLKIEGLSQNDLLNKLKIDVLNADIVLTTILNELSTEKQIKNINNTWALENHTVNIDNKNEEHRKWLLNLYATAGLNIPLLADVEQKAAARNLNKGMLKNILIHLTEQKQLFHFKGDYFHSNSLDKARANLVKNLSIKPNGINEKEFRELMDVSKRIAQIMIDIFIQEGTIKRQSFYLHLAGNKRV